MKTIEEIKTILANYKEELKRRYGVIEIGIFGSYVRGEQREDSDLDVLVDFDRQLSLLDLASLKNFQYIHPTYFGEYREDSKEYRGNQL
jgi:predicted nucleotidyltransferase